MAGFGATDTIDLTNLTYAVGDTVTWTQGSGSGTLSINDGGTTEYFTLAGYYAQNNFSLAPDSGSGAEILFGLQTDNWTGNGNTEWFNAANWNNGVPGAGAEVNITSGALVTFDTSSSDTVYSLSTSRDTTLDITSGSLTITNTADILGAVNGAINVDSGAILTLEGGTSISGSGSIVNNGSVVVASGTSAITGNITGTGSLDIGNGATLELGGTSTNTVTFEHSTGTLQIDSRGASSPYSINGGGLTLPAGDEIYLPNISFHPSADSYNSTTDVITVSKGTPAGTVTIDVVGGIGANDTFTFSQQGTGTLIQDPALSPGGNQAAASVSIGGPGNDNFVFAPGVGADTITNFNPKADTIELDHFANIKSVQQLASLITTDAQGDAVITLGHHDSITLPGVNANYLQTHLHSLVHLG